MNFTSRDSVSRAPSHDNNLWPSKLLLSQKRLINVMGEARPCRKIRERYLKDEIQSHRRNKLGSPEVTAYCRFLKRDQSLYPKIGHSRRKQSFRSARSCASECRRAKDSRGVERANLISDISTVYLICAGSGEVLREENGDKKLIIPVAL